MSEGENAGKIEEVIVIEETPDGIELLEIVVVEELVKKGEPIPRAKLYRIRVDKKTYDVPKDELTGREILKFADKTPEDFKLYEHKPHHQPVEVKADAEVHLRKHGVERFTTMPRDTTEGRGAIRQAFHLPAEDEAYLDSTDLQWETVINGGNWLIIRGWKLPSGYVSTEVMLALMIPPSYPDGEIEMVYVAPSLTRTDGRAINCLSDMAVCGSSWQRWSRHRTAANPWKPGVDDVASHLALVDSWFRREFEGA